MTYVLIVPVWGEHHTGLFLRYFIPFLMTDGNVGAFPNRGLQVRVASLRTDFARMRQDRNYQALAKTTDLVEIAIDDLDLSHPHTAMTACYLGIISTLPKDVVTILPTPDCILSQNCLKRITYLIENGWRAVMVCGLRLSLETAGPLLDQIVPNNTSKRQLCDLVLNHLHPITLSCDVTSQDFAVGWPSHVYWIAPDRTWLLAHCFHLHPMAVRGRPDKPLSIGTIDDNYLLGLGLGLEDIYVCQDSDEFFCVELSPRARRILGPLGLVTKQAIVNFSKTNCNSLHRGFFGQQIRWRGQKEPVIPDGVVRQIDEFVRESKLEKLKRLLWSA